jgi:hypothetical protein
LNALLISPGRVACPYHFILLHLITRVLLLKNTNAGPSGRAVWVVGLDRLDAEIVGSNPA